jgi:general secretion pathway protein I
VLRRAPREQRADSGFTLIEVLVALALVTVVLAAIGAVVAVDIKGTRTLEQRVALTETAHLIATDVVRRELIGTNDLSGEMSGHRWQLRAVPLSVDAASLFIPYHVVLRVMSPSGAILSLETIRLRRKPQ